MNNIEILAPAGGRESLLAAVRCGATAVYLGGKNFNARRSASNFDDGELSDAVSYCRARGVKVYLTLNTLINDRELDDMANAVKLACEAGIDALIVQDLAVAALARDCAPTLPLHASTQMSIYNLDGAKQAEALGFSRVVLARELSKAEILKIHENTSLSLECFVHGALCMSVSGQCYFSAMLGARSGNRGVCAQPCRLPMAVGKQQYGLSLKDLSLIDKIPDMIDAGVSSLKIEGRMKRPEYVAAAVTACRQKLSGETPDLDSLRDVFSRDGFTSGYFDANTGAGMFGTRRHEDVLAANPVLLKKLAATYKNEPQNIPVRFSFKLKCNEMSSLTVTDADGHAATAFGEIPQIAKTSPTTEEKAAAALAKTGGTPFFISGFTADIDEGLMLPASGLNALRRDALEKLTRLRQEVKPHIFTGNPNPPVGLPHKTRAEPELRARIATAEQLTKNIADAARLIIVPALEIRRLDVNILSACAGKIAVELPRILFEGEENLNAALAYAKQNKITRAVCGNLGSIKTAREHGFAAHGDYSLNITNSAALRQYEKLELSDATASIELTNKQLANLSGDMPRGILAYGYLPLMITRNCPVGNCKDCDNPVLTDRLGNKFPVRCGFGATEIFNCVPLFLADRLAEFTGIDFFTLYFTAETPKKCNEILRLYQTGGTLGSPMTRGLYYRGVT